MDEIVTLIVLGVAVLIFGFVLGMFALARAKQVAEHFDRPVPRLPGLSAEQTFGLGGILLAGAGILTVVLR